MVINSKDGFKMSFNPKGPFVKWAGGKKQLLDKLHDRLPRTFGKYYEPFVGGGALLLSTCPPDAIISDVNEQLINIYRQLQAEPNKIINVIRKLDAETCDKDFYLKIRAKYNEKIQAHELDAESAGLMIWINKHCFNGLYRVNGKGLFNVPFNNKTSGKSMDEENLMSIGRYLEKFRVQILCQDFEDACSAAMEGDFVYFDSPYIPISDTANFTDYTKDGFTYEDHVRLSKLYRRLHERGVKVMLSNHDVPLVYKLYDGFKIENVDVRRSINSDAKKRKGKEVIITNYEV